MVSQKKLNKDTENQFKNQKEFEDIEDFIGYCFVLSQLMDPPMDSQINRNNRNRNLMKQFYHNLAKNW